MSRNQDPPKFGTKDKPRPVRVDVLIAGSGPIGCTFARTILDDVKNPELNVTMIDVGSQDHPTIGRHHKNSIKYQKDIDAFVNVIKGALQPVSVPPAATHINTLGAEAWSPNPGQKLISAFNNPNQQPERNLSGCAITRTVGGMATHWTCACPEPHPDERKESPLEKDELLKLLVDAKELLHVATNQYNDSVRNNLVKGILQKAYPGKTEGRDTETDLVTDLPLAVKRNKYDAYVTWSGSDTVLGKYALPEHKKTEEEKKDKRFTLLPEHKLIGFVREGTPILSKTDPNNEPEQLDYARLRHGKGDIEGAYVKDLMTNEYLIFFAEHFVVACGAIATPQILWNSGFGKSEEHPDSPDDDAAAEAKAELPALGHYLAEQSIAFCQIALKRDFIDNIETSEFLTPKLQGYCTTHHENFKEDPIRIPFADPEPQVTMPYTAKTPWHTQIHRDAFSYGDVGPRADPRIIVDLRWFGAQECEKKNYVTFSQQHTDIYGMPQATFNVTRSSKDSRNDQTMMLHMCTVAEKLGPFLPDSYPQFMAPGLALHITGTIRLMKARDDGEHLKQSVANEYSQVHGHKNLFVGGNGVIPDSTACNPTRTSVAYALKSARHIIGLLKQKYPDPTST